MSARIQLGLTNILRLVDKIGSPHLKIPIVHIAGTNGKGSVSAFIDSILRCAGVKTARFNSPHLISIHDSILLNGLPITDAFYRSCRRTVEEANTIHKIEASPFELLTATAFSAFANADPPVDVAIIEVGMGGLTDATNIVDRALVTVLTNVDLDHQAFLGDTVAEIAAIKCGIFKRKCPCVVGPQKHQSVRKVASQRAAELSAPLVDVEAAVADSSGHTTAKLGSGEKISFRLAMRGAHQLENVATAIAAVEELRSIRTDLEISNAHIIEGIEQANWPGRMADLDLLARDRTVTVLVDGAHNPSSALVLAQHLATLKSLKICLIAAFSAPRDPASVLGPVVHHVTQAGKDIQVIATSFKTPIDGMPWVRPVSPQQIVDACQTLGVQSRTALGLTQAVDMAAAHEDVQIVIAGSLYLVSDAYRLQ